MKYLSDYNIQNKRVLLRCDFNVPVVNNKIKDASKINKSLETIKYLLNNNNTVIILSHFGRVKKEEDKKNNSLSIVYEYLKQYIDLDFIPNPLDLNSILNASLKKCFLVENTRFTDTPEKRESDNDLELSRYWASFADVFVIDAFGSMHRAHSSTAGISKYLPTVGGFLVQKEIENLQPLVNDIKRPFIVIMGGAKATDKIKIIESMLEKCDKLIVTGGILNTFLKVAGKNIGKSLVSDEETLEYVKRVLDNYEEKIYFTDRFMVDRNGEVIEISIDEIKDNDIIYDNITNLKDILNSAETIFFNGTCGMYENDLYEKGTIKLLEDLKASGASIYIGGGDTVSAVNNLGYENSFKYLSSGGGATLEYVAYGKLKAIEYIKENSVNNL